MRGWSQSIHYCLQDVKRIWLFGKERKIILENNQTWESDRLMLKTEPKRKKFTSILPSVSPVKLVRDPIVLGILPDKWLCSYSSGNQQRIMRHERILWWPVLFHFVIIYYGSRCQFLPKSINKRLVLFPIPEGIEPLKSF